MWASKNREKGIQTEKTMYRGHRGHRGQVMTWDTQMTCEKGALGGRRQNTINNQGPGQSLNLTLQAMQKEQKYYIGK